MTSNNAQVVHVGPLGTLVIKLTFERTRWNRASECFVLMTPTGTYLEGKHDTEVDAIDDLGKRERIWMMSGATVSEEPAAPFYEVVGVGPMGTHIIKVTRGVGPSSGLSQVVFRLMSVAGDYLPGEHDALEVTQTALDKYERSLLDVMPSMAPAANAPVVVETGRLGTKIVRLTPRPVGVGRSASSDVFVLMSMSNDYLDGIHLSLEDARSAGDRLEQSLIEQGMEKFKPIRRRVPGR